MNTPSIVATPATLATKANALRQELDALDREHHAARARRDHLATHPDLPQQPTVTSATNTTSTGDTH